MKTSIILYLAPALLFLLTACTPQAQQTVADTLTSDTGTETTQEKEMKDKTIEDTSTVKNERETAGQYTSYSKTAFDQAQNKRRVLFFHASWCPTCKVANEELSSQADQLPADVAVFKTDYDSEKDLKKQYGITYQHTFVLVDEAGNEVTKWNGGGIEEILEKI